MAENERREEDSANSENTESDAPHGKFAAALSGLSEQKENEEKSDNTEDQHEDVEEKPDSTEDQSDNADEHSEESSEPEEELSSFEKRMQDNEDKVKDSDSTDVSPLSNVTRRKQTEVTEEEKNPEYQKSGKVVGGIIIFILFAFAAVVGYFVLSDMQQEESNSEPVEPEVETISVPSAPSVLDETVALDEACEEFEEAGFVCSAEEEVNEEYPRGNLVTQSIPAGEEAEAESEIELVYSRGPEESVFPAIQDESQEYVEEELYAIGVDIEDIDHQSDSGIAEDRVIRAEIDGEAVEPESNVTNGAEVVLVVSDGTVEVPDWTDENREVVETEASEIGVDVEFVTEESEEVSGTVLSQSETGSVSNDAVIEITVAVPFESVSLEIPDVIGSSPEMAQAELAEAGFLEIFTLEVESNDAEDPTVTQISPNVGGTTLSDDNVTILVTVPAEAEPEPEADADEEEAAEE